MKHWFLTTLFFPTMSFFVNAQTDKTEFFAGVILQPPLKAGTQLSIGFALEGRYNLLKNNAITFSASISRIGFLTDFVVPYNSEFDPISFLIGYQKNINRFFIEPQVGFGIFSKTITYDELGHQKVFDDGAFFWGVTGGYKILKRYRIFIRYHRLNSVGISHFDNKFGYGGLGISIKLD